MILGLIAWAVVGHAQLEEDRMIVTSRADAPFTSFENEYIKATGLSAGILTKPALLKRADQGDLEATRLLAIGHEQRLFGFAENSEAARKCFEIASDLSDPVAQVVIAELLLGEEHCEREEAAVELIGSASKANNPQAAAELVYRYGFSNTPPLPLKNDKRATLSLSC